MKNRFVEKELESELILHDAEKDDVHVLNATAKFIYNLYKEGKDVTEMEREVKKDFQIEDGQDIRHYVEDCLNELKEKGLIK